MPNRLNHLLLTPIAAAAVISCSSVENDGSSTRPTADAASAFDAASIDAGTEARTPTIPSDAHGENLTLLDALVEHASELAYDLDSSRRDAADPSSQDATLQLPKDAAANVELPPLRLELPCDRAQPSSDPTLCLHDAHTMGLIAMASQLGGDPGVSYEITLRIRGVVEPRTYLDANGKVLAQGLSAPILVEDATPSDRADYQLWAIETGSGDATAYLNAFADVGHKTFAIDEQWKLTVPGKTTFRLRTDDSNERMIANFDHLVVPAIAPAPSWFDGQFVSVELTSVRQAP